MPKQSYWEKREKDHIKREQMKDEEIAREIERIIQIALLEAEKEIRNFYSRYAGKNNLTPAEAKKAISEFDVQAFEAIAAKYVKEKNFSDKANKELYTYNTKMRISRQELLMMYLNAHLVVMADEQVKTMQEYFEEAAMSEVARQAGILGANIVITQPTLLSIVGASFHGAVWSTRIWDDMVGLREELDRIITSSIIRGAHPDKFIKDIRERFSVSTFYARRLLITEVARVQTEAQKISYQKLGDEDAEYRFIALMDDRTTKTCKSLNGKRFKVKDMKPGVNAPPMHPFCRSSTVLDLGDWRTKFFEEKKKTYALDADDEKAFTIDDERVIKNYMGAQSYVVNDKLRNGYKLDEDEKKFVKNLDRALGKMPKYKGDLTRSLYFNTPKKMKEFLSKHEIDNVVQYNGYTSTTKGVRYNPESQVELYILDSKNGRDLTKFNAAEAEILYERDAKFKVVGRETFKGVEYIFLEEYDE
ncbi:MULTISPECIES: minor capsid protein [Clostridia]|uniref:minor capsid protein n=1 Tax=Clostridia TaxID=186801 RepID=UPI000EA23BAA|nr:minor capsid protein [Clostridium sp. 1xD42-85]NBJ71333.1 phage head morphogenesis protein [Roseburia sp. 1XD42-34]RKI74410.1 phage head morphogenesis protein [Clostridium sp. 1xD42-85]